MSNISAAQVKSLREKTGISMADCKSALVEANGDEAQAIEVLKKKYAGKLDKRADKEAANGRIGAFADGKVGALVEFRCETDFVANNEAFAKAANSLAALVASTGVTEPNQIMETAGSDGKTGKDIITEAYSQLQEKMEIARACTQEKGSAFYIHHNGLVGSLVAAEGDDKQAAKNICMHVAAQPVLAGLCREDVDPKEVEEARQMMAEQAAGKPARSWTRS